MGYGKLEYKNIGGSAEAGGVHALEVDVGTRTIAGYLAIFNVCDLADEIIAPGAFKNTFRTRGPKKAADGSITSMIKCGWNHPGWQSNGQVIGVPIVLREDSVGAYFEAVVDRTPVGDLVLERIRSRSLDGCSFAYNVTDSEPIYGAKPEVLVGGMVRTPRRLLKELQVVEIGPVDFPCHEGTRLFLHGALKAAPGLDGFKRDRDAASLLSNLDRLQRSLGAIADRSDEFKDTPARPHVTSNHYNQHHAWVQADSQERKARIMEQERRAARELAELRAEYAQPPRTRQSTDHELSLALRDLRALSSSLSSALTKATNDRNYHSDQIGSWTREQAARRRASAWSR